MKQFQDIPLLDIGHTIQLVGMVLSGNGETYVSLFPDEKGSLPEPLQVLPLETADWEALLYQSDVLNVELVGPKKSIVRKSQRLVDQNVAWDVYKRDGYRCRYCGKEGPLTVDHIILWEAGGLTIADNLIAACRKCNRTRGNTSYADWINSRDYQRLSARLDAVTSVRNLRVLTQLSTLEQLAKPGQTRSR